MFGELVRAQRRRLGLSQEDLADRTGVGVRSIGKIENGRISEPRPVTVRLLADAFGLSGGERDQFCASAAGPDAQLPGVEPVDGRAAPPAQLPPDVGNFVGRDVLLHRLGDLLDATDRPTTVAIVAIAGSAGVGKTTLAIHWGHRIRHRFPDGQLYVDLRGFDPTGTVMHPAEAARRFLEALEVPAHRIPSGLQARAGLLRTVLAGRRMLIVLDNARDAEQVRPLLPGVRGCLVVITSRSRLSSLVAGEGAHPFALDLLTMPEARALLGARLGNDRVAAEPDAVEEIVLRCVQLPLALAVVAARAASQPTFPLRTFAAELRHDHERLDVLAGEDPTTDVRAVFSWSYRALSAPAARLFRLLGMHPGPDLSVPAAAALAASPLREARRLLAELSAAHLIEQPEPGRFWFHDLLRAFAVERGEAEQPKADREAARRRLLDHYVHSAVRAAMVLSPTRDPIDPVPAAETVVPESPADHAAAIDWFTAEYRVLLAGVAVAAASGLDRHAWQLAWSMQRDVSRRGSWAEYAGCLQIALASARRVGDPLLEACTFRFLALAALQLDQPATADEHLARALVLYRAAGDRLGQAHTHLHQGQSYDRQGRRVEALESARSALELFRAAGHYAGQATAWNGMGWLQAQLGRHAEALVSCRQALRLHRATGGSRDEIAATLDSLAHIHEQLGDYVVALDCYRQALHLVRENGDRFWQAMTLSKIRDLQLAAGDVAGADDLRLEALTVLAGVQHPDAASLRSRLDDPGAPGSALAYR